MSTQLTQGQRVCFTGKMRQDRWDVEAIASRAGLRPTSKAAQADVVVVANGALFNGAHSSKRQIAERRGIPILSEDEFFAQIALPLPAMVAANAPAVAVTGKPPKRRPNQNALIRKWKPTGVSGSVNF